MPIFNSTTKYEDFFRKAAFRKYEKFEDETRSEMVFHWLQQRVDWLMSSITNHKKPALQGVIVDLENLMMEEYGWTIDNKGENRFFIQMIGAMVHFLVSEFGYEVLSYGISLRNNKIIKTAATYKQK